MVEQAKLKLNLVGKPVDHTDYRSMIRSLMYVTSSRPDIMFATSYIPAAVDEPTIPSPTQPPPPSQDIPSTFKSTTYSTSITSSSTPSPQRQAQPPQPLHDTQMSMDLLHTLLETCTTLTRRVKHLEQDKIAQTLEITKLKQRVKKLERRNKLKGRIIDKDVTMQDVADTSKEVAVDAEIEESVDVQGRQAESQVQIYQINLEHANKVLSMQDDELELAELQKVVEVVTTAKLMTEVVTAASATINAADTSILAATITAAAPAITTAPSAARRRKGVVIRDPKKTATPSTIIHTEPKSKDKGKGIMMVNTRTDLDLSAAVQNALQTLLPRIREEIRKEFRTRSGSSNAGGNPPPVTIHTWLERFNKQKPHSFEKATAPVDAKNWISHMEKIFDV
nr:zinc finger, CCHC-type, retrotransposon Gag domain protein [Tanacetum cinerariifolium]